MQGARCPLHPGRGDAFPCPAPRRPTELAAVDGARGGLAEVRASAPGGGRRWARKPAPGGGCWRAGQKEAIL